MLSNTRIEYDFVKLKAVTILFGVTSKRDWRNQDLQTIDEIDQRMMNEELRPLLRQDHELDIDTMKSETKNFISRIFTYEENEMSFLTDFLDHGDYKPELLFGQTEQARILNYHPAVQWKLQNLRRFRGLDK